MSHENEVEQLNIAICDDEENIRIYIRKLIQKQETFCKITEFSSGKELLEFQDETNAEEIDILFLDISMGDEDGMTVAKQLRSQMESNFEQVFAQTIREYQYLMAKKKEKPKEVLVRNGNRTRSVSADDIYYIESSNRKVTLYLRHEKIEYYDKISSLESELKPDFFRIHKGYLVNIKYVERYDRTEVKMRNGDSLLISKYKYQDFVKRYLEYISEER
jgi:DNA-binding LytR/AlgR family response regulator